jgi:hypothetical protein
VNDAERRREYERFTQPPEENRGEMRSLEQGIRDVEELRAERAGRFPDDPNAPVEISHADRLVHQLKATWFWAARHDGR